MSIRKQILQPQTLRHFKLPGNPFDEVASSDEFYANEQLRTRVPSCWMPANAAALSRW